MLLFWPFFIRVPRGSETSFVCHGGFCSFPSSAPLDVRARRSGCAFGTHVLYSSPRVIPVFPVRTSFESKSGFLSTSALAIRDTERLNVNKTKLRTNKENKLLTFGDDAVKPR